MEIIVHLVGERCSLFTAHARNLLTSGVDRTVSEADYSLLADKRSFMYECSHGNCNEIIMLQSTLKIVALINLVAQRKQTNRTCRNRSVAKHIYSSPYIGLFRLYL